MAKLSFKKAPEATTPHPSNGLLLHFFANFFNYFVVIMCLLILAAGFIFLIWPKYKFVKSNQQVLKEEDVYQQKLAYRQQLNEIKSLYATVSQSDKDKIDLVLSAGEDVDTLKITLLREIGYIARLNRASLENPEVQVLDNPVGKFVALNKEKASSQASHGKLEIILISFTLEKTDYDQMKSILARLERSLRLIDVTKLEFDPLLRRAKVELYAYHLKK